MKTTISTLLFIALTWVPGCKKPAVREEVNPNPPQPPANCRIVRTTYKHPTIGLNPKSPLIKEPETVTLDDGEKVQVSLITKTTYKYDEQGRVIECKKQNVNTYESELYTYMDRYIVRQNDYTQVGSNKTTTLFDTIPLNERGFRSRYSGLGESYLFYNEAGQIADVDNIADNNTIPYGQTHQYSDGNLSQQTMSAIWTKNDGQWVANDVLLKQYRYELTRPSSPLIYQFQGKNSRNLLTKELWYAYALGQAPVYQKTYAYTYDKLGRVKRRVVNGKTLNPGWLIEDDLYGVGVTDYEYECP